MEQRVLIAGAGLAGATAARILAEQGKQVTVVEERNHIAGNCYDSVAASGLMVQRYGPHIFHSKNKEVWQFVSRFCQMRPYQHRVLSFVEGQYLPFPINRDTLCQLYGIDISSKEVHSFLQAEVASSTFNTPARNFRDAVVSQVGEHLYNCFYANYTAKQWQLDPQELPADLAGRIQVRENRDDRYFTDPYQGMPAAGYTALIANMLDHPAIEIKLGCKFTRGLEQAYDLLVYTGCLDEFFAYAHGKLSYRSVRFDFRTVNEGKFQNAAVVNYPNDYDFTRITEFKHLTGEQGSSSELCFEYPVSEGIPCYVVNTTANENLRQKYLQELRQLTSSCRHIFVGRLAEYRYYNMDQVIASVMEALNYSAETAI